MAWSSIIMRVADIIENDVGLNPVSNAYSTHCYRYPPATINTGITPNVVLLPQGDNSMAWAGGNRHTVNYLLQMRVYIQPMNVALEPTSQFDVYGYLDLFRSAFISRPQLQYLDTALTGVTGNLLFKTLQGLNRPVDYPPSSRLNLSWGLVCELTIPMLQVIPIKITGQ